MTPERFRQIEKLYHAARAKTGDERAALLAETNPELRREIESLLAQPGSGEFLDRHALENAGEMTAPDLGDSMVTALTAEAQLGPYRIEGRLGEGGMGEVFRAVDTRLGRAVALKMAHDRFGARFEREARAISSLNHPHICTLYDVGPDYIVMEYVDGKPIKGPLLLPGLVEYAGQICDALDVAHRKSIVHRDLKPSNILITRQGVKVVDFGLAKMPGEETQTLTGIRVGTPSYMAPEQWDGGNIDARTDIFALGYVLLEMSTGNRADKKSSNSPVLDRVIQSCLAADPEERWQSAREVKLALQMALPPTSPTVPSVSRKWMVATAAVAVLCLAVLGWVQMRPRPSTPGPARLSLDPPPDASFTEFGFALSPDSRNVAFIAETAGKQSLWARRLDSLVASEIPGTEGATYPFWSPDSKALGFFQQGKLKRVALPDGLPATVCDAVNSRGGTWGANGVIIFAPVAGGGLLRVPADGGKPEFLTQLDVGRKETEHRWPRFLPDGKRFLYWVQSTNSEATGHTFPQLISPPVRFALCPPTGSLNTLRGLTVTTVS